VAKVAALLERRGALTTVRRALSSSGLKAVTARSAAHLDSLLSQQVLDSVVLGAESLNRSLTFDTLRADYPTLPVILFAQVRSDDAALIRRATRRGVAAVLIEGLDDPVLGRRVKELGASARRSAALLELSPALGLVEDLQLAAWKLIVDSPPGSISTESIAHQLGIKRETLSRSFPAGSAPTLKTAIDAVRLVAAGQLLGSPAWGVADVARLLGYSSPSLLQRSARRIAGTSARALGTLPPDRILAKLLIGRGPRWT
jgi:AraC-like DNA-binding protein